MYQYWHLYRLVNQFVWDEVSEVTYRRPLDVHGARHAHWLVAGG